MKRKIMNDKKGFTLAELLIVVAIIAVLVAISIPIFTSQLEKSREATDLANVRAAYAEVMSVAILEDQQAQSSLSQETIFKGEDKYSITISPLKQTKEGWQSKLPIEIAGVIFNGSETDHWKGSPGKDGSCEIIYSSGDIQFIWKGGSGSASGDSRYADGNAYPIDQYNRPDISLFYPEWQSNKDTEESHTVSKALLSQADKWLEAYTKDKFGKDVEISFPSDLNKVTRNALHEMFNKDGASNGSKLVVVRGNDGNYEYYYERPSSKEEMVLVASRKIPDSQIKYRSDGSFEKVNHGNITESNTDGWTKY